ncbi:chemotaxis protein [Myxococcus sp. MISCRS1]|uniref:chemotaxis protein n=1 Tax=Myxococcus sp. MISCRS1 TaxID=2996786 RepID=UPI00226F334B|nr:chemotaxis protein [Myxococcus sp. MISCRS1]MCY0996715.1 chemotaxis protein [Myxococcus sp. MISCRS1]
MSPPRRLVGCVLLLLWVSGCSVAAPRSELVRRVGRSDLSVEALRVRVRDMARRFSGLLEASADEIAAESGSEEVRAAMTRFKINAVPAMQAALLQPDPVAALVDAWALLAQLELALPPRATGAGASPELVARAERMLRQQEAEVEALWKDVCGRQDVEGARARVHEWAAKHPLVGPLVTRVSTVSLLAEVTSMSGMGALGTAGVLVEDVRDLTARVDLYAASLPRQARWQAESMAQDALKAVPTREVLADLGRAVDTLEQFGALAAGTSALVARERSAMLSALTSEREALQRFVEQERRALMVEVAGERQAVLSALHTERVETLQQGERIGLGMVDLTFQRATLLVDRVFLWLLGMTLVGVLGGLGLAALLLRAWRRKPG